MTLVGTIGGAGRWPRAWRCPRACISAVPDAPEPIQFRHTIVGLSAHDYQHLAGRPLRSRLSPSPTRRAVVPVRAPGRSRRRRARSPAPTTRRSRSGLPTASSSRTSTGGKLKRGRGRRRRLRTISRRPRTSPAARGAPAAAGRFCSAPRKGSAASRPRVGAGRRHDRTGQGRDGPLLAELPAGRHPLHVSGVVGGRRETSGLSRHARLEGQAKAASARSRTRSTPSPGYHLLSSRADAVRAAVQRRSTLAFTGEPVQIAGGVAAGSAGRGLFDVSQTGP